MEHASESLEQQLSMIARLARQPAALPDGSVVQRSTSLLLHLLAEQGPLRIGAVALAFGLDPSTVTRQIQQADREGYIERLTDPTDRRASLLMLTDAGRAARRAIAKTQREGLEKITADWQDQDRDDLVRLLALFNSSVARLRAEATGERQTREV